MQTINMSEEGSTPQPLLQHSIPLRRSTSIRTPDGEHQSIQHPSAHENTDSISCGCLPSLPSLSNQWNRFWNKSNTKSKSGPNNAESLTHNKIKTTIPDPLTVPIEEAAPLVTAQGVVHGANMEVTNSHAPSSKIDPSDLGLLNDSDFDEGLNDKLSKPPNAKELNDLAETADVHWPNKRKFILDQEETSSYAFLCLFKGVSDDELVRIFDHKNFPNVSEGTLFHMIRYVKPLTELQRLDILNHKNATGHVYSEFIRNNLPHNITKKERLAIERSTRASMDNLTNLYKTLPENEKDAIKEMVAILMNPNVIGGVVKVGDVEVVEPIIERLPRLERMKLISDPKTSSMIITFLFRRLTLSKTKMRDFNAAEYQEELNAIIDNDNTDEDTLEWLTPEASSDKRKDIINHRNAGDLSLPRLAEDASPEECEAIWKRTLDIGSKIRSNPESNLASNCWSTWKALRNNGNCPPWVRDEINLKFAREEGPLPLHARILRWQSESAQ